MGGTDEAYCIPCTGRDTSDLTAGASACGGSTYDCAGSECSDRTEYETMARDGVSAEGEMWTTGEADLMLSGEAANVGDSTFFREEGAGDAGFDSIGNFGNEYVYGVTSWC